MGSSTWHPASSDRWRLLALWTAVLGGPLIWLLLLQTSYVLVYPACADRTNTSLIVVALAGVLGVAVLALGAWRWRRRQDDPPARAFLGAIGVAMSVSFLVLVIATAIPPLLLHPCD